MNKHQPQRCTPRPRRALRGGELSRLLKLPEFLRVVKEWDNFIRTNLSESHPWFANISPETGKLDSENSNISKNRHAVARKDLKEWLERVRLPYHSPHKFRHGFAVYSLKHAKDIRQLKAISQIFCMRISVSRMAFMGDYRMRISKNRLLR